MRERLREQPTRPRVVRKSKGFYEIRNWRELDLPITLSFGAGNCTTDKEGTE